MKKIALVFMLLMTLFGLSACSNDLLEQAIEDCKNDPECYVIVDDAISEELESRGIKYHEMTSNEMNEISNLLLEFNPSKTIFNREYTNELLMMSGLEGLFNEIVSSNELDLFYEYVDYLDLININPDSKLSFIYNQNRILIYKVSEYQFIYEVQDNQILEYTIDLELGKLFLNDINIPNFTKLQDDLISSEIGVKGTQISKEGDLFCAYRNSNEMSNFEQLGENVSYNMKSDFYMGCYDISTKDLLRIELHAGDSNYQLVLSIQGEMNYHINNIPVDSFFGNFSELIIYLKTFSLSPTDMDSLSSISDFVSEYDISFAFSIYNLNETYTSENLSIDDFINQFDSDITVETIEIEQDDGSTNVTTEYFYQGSMILQEIVEYYTNGIVRLEAKQIQLFGVMTDDIKSYYEDGTLREVMINTSNASTGDSLYESKQYDENGVIVQTEYTFDQGIASESIYLEYYANGQIYWEHSTYTNSSTQTENNYDIYYDESGNITSYEHTEIINGNVTYYDEDGNVIE